VHGDVGMTSQTLAGRVQATAAKMAAAAIAYERADTNSSAAVRAAGAGV
jgi:hypothetical protein